MGVKLPIYMDNHATTPVDPRVFEAMTPCFVEKFGNPASRNHVFGWEAAEAVEKARRQVAKVIHAEPDEIIFTSGATESDNLAVKGAAWSQRERGNHIITAVTEHKAVLDSCKRLEHEGFRVTYLPVDRNGQVHAEDVRHALTPQTVLVSLMAANNEIGVLHPLAEIGRLCREVGVLFHTDAAQAAGKVPLDVREMNIDLLSLTAHKMYGPKGIGALYVRRRPERVNIQPMMDGGGHELGLRSGTLAVPGIVGLGAACEIAASEMKDEAARTGTLREQLLAGLQSRLDGVRLNGHPVERLPGNLNVSFTDVEGELLMTALNDVAVSSGAACISAGTAPSYVLGAIGVDDDLAHSTLRFGIGRFNTGEEVDYVVERVGSVVTGLRRLAAGN